MAERKTQKKGYRASCLTCQKVIPKLRGGVTDTQVQRFKANLKSACNGIANVLLLTATNAAQHAQQNFNTAIQKRQILENTYNQKKSTYGGLMQNVQQTVKDNARLACENAERALKKHNAKIPNLEDTYRTAVLRKQIIAKTGEGNANQLNAECDARGLKSDLNFASF